MQNVHLTFPLEHFHAMVAAFEEQYAAQPEDIAILDFGCSYKLQQGYIVLEWQDSISPEFIEYLSAESNILDFTVYSIPCLTNEQVSLLEPAVW
jgi:hypothetical protein